MKPSTVLFACSLPLALALGLPAAATTPLDDYPASVVTRTELSVKSPVREGQDSIARVRVTADVKDTPEGTVELTLDGAHLSTVTLRGGSARARIPSGDLEPGSHTVAAEFVPVSGSAWQGSSDSAMLEVTCRKQCGEEPGKPPRTREASATTPSDDEGGTLGGVAASPVTWGLGGLVLLGAGGFMLSRRLRG